MFEKYHLTKTAPPELPEVLFVVRRLEGTKPSQNAEYFFADSSFGSALFDPGELVGVYVLREQHPLVVTCGLGENSCAREPGLELIREALASGG